MKKPVFKSVIRFLSRLGATLIAVEVALRLVAFVNVVPLNVENFKAAYKRSSYKILFLGDSIMGGVAPLLKEKLLAKNPGIDFATIDLLKGGISTSRVLQRVESALDTYHPDVVVVMMGLSDKKSDSLAGDSSLERKGFLNSLLIYQFIRQFDRSFTVFEKKASAKIEPCSMVESCSALAELYKRDGKFQLAEETYKKIISISPHKYNAYVSLVAIYSKYHCLDQSEQYFSGLIRLGPEKVLPQRALALTHVKKRDFGKAQEIYMRLFAENPKNEELYKEIISLYSVDNWNKLSEVEGFISRVIELNPGKAAWLYAFLVKGYASHGMIDQAEEASREALRRDPKSFLNYYASLAKAYQKKKMFLKEAEVYEQVIALDPKKWAEYIKLARIYLNENNEAGALRILNALSSVIASFPDGDEKRKRYTTLASILERMGRGNLAEKFRLKGSDGPGNYYEAYTVSNFRKAENILSGRGIRSVFVQYPLCSVIPLKRIFKDRPGLVFVDNTKVFQDALRKGKYEDYFEDTDGAKFAGTIWGHCTSQGKDLIAQNIADAITNEILNRPRAGSR